MGGGGSVNDEPIGQPAPLRNGPVSPVHSDVFQQVVRKIGKLLLGGLPPAPRIDASKACSEEPSDTPPTPSQVSRLAEDRDRAVYL